MNGDRLSSEGRDEIFENTIWPHFSRRLVPQVGPEAYILGGQPGAGKSHFLRVLSERLDNPLIINGDDLRGFHPFYYSYLKENEREAADRVQEDINVWIEGLIRRIAKERGNMIIEGTMRSSEVPLRTAVLLDGEGYKTSAHVVLTRPEISIADMFLRYEMQKKLVGLARYTKPEIHDEAFKSLPGSILEVCRSPHVARTSLYRRKSTDYEIIYEGSLGVEGGKEHNEQELLDCLERERGRKLMVEEEGYLSQAWERTFSLAREHGADKEYLAELERYYHRGLSPESEVRFL